MISKKARIYRRLIPVRPITLDYPTGKKDAMPPRGAPSGKAPAVSYADLIRQAFLTRFAASLVLVDRKGQILQFLGRTDKYLNLPTGEPILNLLDIAKRGLSPKIRSAVHKAVLEGKPVVMDNVQLVGDESPSFIRIAVLPMLRDETEPLMAVFFEEVPRPSAVKPEPTSAGDNETIVRQLEDELRATQRGLQSTIEELQASNEELRTANQEVIATNEELQSTNEEIESSKEELQSVNEELTTVNNELQDKVETLNKANSDMANFLSSTRIATLFLDNELRIKLFTPAATRIFNLIPSDTGRPISDLSLNFIGYDLTADARLVIQNGSSIEREARHTDGSSYLIRIMPYRTSSDHADGVILTFGDVTSLRHAESQTRRLATVVTAANDAVVLFDLKGNIQSWNRGAEKMYGWSEAEALRMNFRDITPADKRSEHLDLISRLMAGETIDSFETQRLTRENRVLDVWLTAASLADEAGKMDALATVERDVTERKRSERELRALNEALEQRAHQLRYLASELTLAEQQEQSRLAQILHDGLQQILVGAKYQLAFLEHSNDLPKATAGVTSLIDEAIKTSRSLTAELSPPILHRAGLIPGLQWLVGWMKEKHDFTVNLTAPEKVESCPESISTLLFRAARELLFNAVKHAGVKNARLEVAQSDGFIKLVVEDKGTGFDPSRLTAESHLKGIGLFSLRERLSLLGGRMEIDSSPGSGSRFKIVVPCTLPTLEESPIDVHKLVSDHRIAPKARDGPKRIKVLLADDHTIVRQGLAGLIRAEQDMEVAGEASDGESAVDAAREVRPDVVLMDINMPGMNGIDATRTICREFPDIRVIGLSMFREGEQAAAMREAGAVDYIDKSGPSDALLSTIRACLNKSTAAE
jgi:two-component system CheB/CheR fusion protein